MVDEPDRKLTQDELRARFLDEKLYKWQRLLSYLEDPNFEKPITYLAEGASFRFHRLRHGELTLLSRLKFFGKIVSNEPLTDDEKTAFIQMKGALLGRVSLDEDRWKRLIAEHPGHIEMAWQFLEANSGVPANIDAQLKEFFATDFGWVYGKVWFGMMGLTPTEIAAKSEADYHAVMSWILANAERMKPR